LQSRTYLSPGGRLDGDPGFGPSFFLRAVGTSEGDSDSRSVVQATEILAAIERGEPIEYDFVIVEGELNLSELNLPTEHVERTWADIEYFGLTEDVKLVESLPVGYDGDLSIS